MTGGCVRCGKPITSGVTWTQHAHDDCYINGIDLEMLEYLVVVPPHMRDKVDARIRLLKSLPREQWVYTWDGK